MLCLGLIDEQITHKLCTRSNVDDILSEVINIKLTSASNDNYVTCTAYVIDVIPIIFPSVDVSTYPHLQDLPLTANYMYGDVEVLLGQDCADAFVPLEIRKGLTGQPFATRTMLGWSLNSPAYVERPTSSVIANFISASCIERNINQLWDIDNDYNNVRSLSHEDKKVIDLWNSECKLIDGHFELPFPWCKNISSMPDNMYVAVSRLQSLEKSLKRCNLLARYNDGIQNLVNKVYAEILTSELLRHSGSRTWYLPHHAVCKDDKLGIAFDCASKLNNVSLNSSCLQGPDLNNTLFSALIGFREHHYGIMADVEAMYHQVRVPDYDRDSLGFLWRDNERSVKHYRMTYHLFGGVWCSSVATYALHRTLYGFQCDLVSNVVQRSFYVDDGLTSARYEEEAKLIIHSVRSVLQNGGFNLTKFVISDMNMLERIVPYNHRAKEVKDLNPMSDSKALGIKWQVASDSFFFVAVLPQDNTFTKRAILSFVAPVFDPLGLISPIILKGRMIFQRASRLNIGWDDELPQNIQKEWVSWCESLRGVQMFLIPICFKPHNFDDAVHELHCFCDASQDTYGCVIYLRSVNKHGDIHTALICSKSRLSPLKSTTLPRLELQAAVLVPRVVVSLKQPLTLSLVPSHYWTDSKIVLAYICNEERRFHVYVSNRVHEIRRHTGPRYWHHIAGTDKPTDVITRGALASNYKFDSWCKGPNFLMEHKDDWSHPLIDISELDGDPEVKVDKSSRVFAVDVIVHPLDMLLAHYSSWYHLRRAISWLVKVKDHLVHKKPF